MYIPVIYGLSGLELSVEERDFFLENPPFGFILFKRNCDSREQITALTKSLRELFPDRKVEVLIDQEGGRVARLRPPISAREYPAPKYFADLYNFGSPELAKQALHVNYIMLIKELQDCGVTITCAPLADLFFEDADKIIGDRSFGSDPKIVAEMCITVLQALKEAGSEGVIKHIPGHGRATCDSHLELPTVTCSLAELENTDFLPFKLISSQAKFAMTAHIKFTALDQDNPVTLSMKAINYIRDSIGFKGLIMTDDMSMKALKGDIGDLTKQALDAGCDLILHCNGDMREMKKIAQVLSGSFIRRDFGSL